MKIANADTNRRSVPIMVRLTPPMYDKLMAVCKQAGGGIGTTVRSILEEALTEGIDVVDSPIAAAEASAPPKRRRRSSVSTEAIAQ